MNFEQWIAPETYNLTSEMENHPSDRIALRWLSDQKEVEEITYGDLFKQANRLAGGLRELGLVKGDRVLVMVPRRIIAYAIYIACLKLGIAVIPSSEMLRAKDLEYRLRHSSARAVIVWSETTSEVEKMDSDLPALAHRIVASPNGDYAVPGEGWVNVHQLMQNQPDEMAAVETHRDDMAILAYTSGTTGNPKVSYIAMAGVMHICGLHRRYGWISSLPIRCGQLQHRGGKMDLEPVPIGPRKRGNRLGIQRLFPAEALPGLMQAHQINVLCCTPTEYRLMAKTDDLGHYDLSHLRSAVSAGEPLNQEVIEIFQRHFDLTIRDGYGQTESTLLIGSLKDAPVRIGSMGQSITRD